MEMCGVFPYSLIRTREGKRGATLYLERVGESVVLPVYDFALYLFSLHGPGEGDLVSSPCVSHTSCCPTWGFCTVPLHVR